jgi:plastocyanin
MSANKIGWDGTKGRGPMMTRFTTALVALMASFCALALVAVTAASAGSSHSGLAAHRTGRIVQGTSSPGGPRTWHVLVGGQSENQAVQAEGYYPHVITINAGDTVVWTLNTVEIHGVVFTGTCAVTSCIPPDCLKVNIDISPCGPSSYDGVTALVDSGRMVLPVYKWDKSVPHGNTTFSLTFTRPGVNVYFDLSVAGMRGVVIVHPAGTPYPFTQAEYSEQSQDQLRADLAAGARARGDGQPVATSVGPGGKRTYHVAVGASPPETARFGLGPAAGSAARGSALLEGSGIGTLPNPSIAVTIKLSGLAPGSVHAVQILPGVCGAPAPTTGIIFSQIFVPPKFTLHNVTAGPDGTATSTTVITAPPVLSGPGQLAIPSSGWFINVTAGHAPDNGATSAACGNVVFHSAAVMRYFPQNVRIHVGDTVVWTNDTSNEPHGVTFLAGRPLPVLPEWFTSKPTGNGISYDGSSFFNSGLLYRAAPGRNHSLTLTFTRSGTFPYVDVADVVLGMHGSVIVAPGSPPGAAGLH